jgi:hypothetical protein
MCIYVCRVMLSSWQLNFGPVLPACAKSLVFWCFLTTQGICSQFFFSGKPLLGGERKGVPADVLWLSLTLYTNHHWSMCGCQKTQGIPMPIYIWRKKTPFSCRCSLKTAPLCPISQYFIVFHSMSVDEIPSYIPIISLLSSCFPFRKSPHILDHWTILDA